MFGMAFYFFNIVLFGFMEYLAFEGDYASALLSLWAALPAVVLFFTGIRLIMVQQKRG